ncbi:hypothetical protein [Neisseria sicca]|uniref:hypothetical protein n=1 Tax=Neisseria sicca TaxID=490 RepID=UPI0002F1432B
MSQGFLGYFKNFYQSPWLIHIKGRLKTSKTGFQTTFVRLPFITYSGLNLNQDKATKPQTVQIVRQGEATPYWFKFNPL